MHFNYVLHISMILGVVASSISGSLRAIEVKMDITGSILLAFLVSNSGGTLRDIVLGIPVFWISNTFYLWISIIIGAITFIIIYYRRKFIGNYKLYKALLISDAFGLAAFSVVGVDKALISGYSYGVAIFMGVCTAIGGGIIADIVANRIPLVFSQELYITIAFLGSLLYLILGFYFVNTISGLIAIIFMIMLRLISIRYNIRFPIIK